MSKMFWQANSEEKSLFRLFFANAKMAEFAFIDQKYAIGKITDTALREEQIWVFSLIPSGLEIFNAKNNEKFGSVELDASRNGEVKFSDETVFSWTQIAWTSFDRVWKDDSDENLIVFELNDKKAAENFVGLKLSPKASINKHIFLLILLGWALIVQDKSKMGANLLAEGNPQKFLAEEKIKEIFGIEFSAENFSKQIAAATAVVGTVAVASESSIGLEEVAEAVEIGFDLLDWF